MPPLAQVTGFISRAEAGLVKARSFSSNIKPERGGVALHYGGPPAHLRSHAGCVRQWRGWQDFHMNEPSRRWADIAYSMGVCDHGYALAGRGAFRRTAANGTDAGNDAFYAVCWLGGEGEVPSDLAISAFAWCVNELRQNGRAGDRVLPHSFFKGTGCPGDHLRWLAASLDQQDLSTTRPPITPQDPEEEDMRVVYVDKGAAALLTGGKVVPLDNNTEVNAYRSAGVPVKPVTQAELDTLVRVSARIRA